MRHLRPLRTLFSTLPSCRSGTTAVEFALLAPIFLAIMLGLAAYGILFGATNSVQQLAADAARVAVGGVSAAERRDLATRYIDSNTERYAFLNRSRLVLATEANGADTFVVSLSYDASDLPIWSLMTGLPLPGKTIVRRSTIHTGAI